VPQVPPAEFEALPLHAFALTRGLPLHDVWTVELAGGPECTIQALADLLTEENIRTLPLPVRALFAVRSGAGRAFKLDDRRHADTGPRLVDSVPEALARASLVPPGTPARGFRTLYALADEAALEARNATVHAVLVVALVPSETGRRLYWGTYVEPVGAVTRFYMGLIDPFRRWIVYPGLESWLVRTWRTRDRPQRSDPSNGSRPPERRTNPPSEAP